MSTWEALPLLLVQKLYIIQVKLLMRTKSRALAGSQDSLFTAFNVKVAFFSWLDTFSGIAWFVIYVSNYPDFSLLWNKTGAGTNKIVEANCSRDRCNCLSMVSSVDGVDVVSSLGVSRIMRAPHALVLFLGNVFGDHTSSYQDLPK